MELERTLRKVGGSVMLPLPPETLAESGLQMGDSVRIISRPGRIEVAPAPTPDDEVAAFAARFARRYHDALARLAQ
jgi:anaerobic selenocysteine-containing dehydrogenase